MLESEVNTLPCSHQQAGEDSSSGDEDAADAEVAALLGSKAVRRGAKSTVSGPEDVNPFELAEPSSSSSSSADNEEDDEDHEDEEVEALPARGGKRRSKDLSSDFAPLEEYAHLLNGQAERDEPASAQATPRGDKQSKRRRK